MNSLLMQGLKKLSSEFTSYFQDRKNAERVWTLKDKNPQLLKDFVWKEYSSIKEKDGLEKAYRWSSFIFSGWKPKKIRLFAKKVWKAELKRTDELSVSPYQEMIEFISFLQEHNWKVFIITASPEEVIQEVSSQFFIPEENVIGMKPVIKDGISTSEILEPYTYGEGKVAALREIIGTNADLSFGDSENDLPLLKSAKRFGVLIDRGNKELVEKCKSFHCLIQPAFK